MRLTEPPRKLAEMRPEVAWTSDVQAVLDRALERDASARYQSATDFGRDLSRALERMVTADGNTARVSRGAAAAPPVYSRESLPPTRVGANRGSQGRDSARAAATGSLPPFGRRATAVAAGAGGLVLVGALAAAMVMRDDGKPAKTDIVTPAGRPTSEVSPAQDTARFAQSMDSSPGARRASEVAGPAVDGAAAARASAVAVSARLDSLESIVSGDVSLEVAGRVVRELEQMRGRITGNEQLVHAAIVEALAESSRNNRAAACGALRRVQSIAPGTSRAKQVESTMSLAC